MDETNGPVNARLDVVERRILAQGKTPEEWAVEVTQPVGGVWTTFFYVGAQGFRLAHGDKGEESERDCMFIGQMFVKALQSFTAAQASRSAESSEFRPHRARLLSFDGHCSQCGAKPGEPCGNAR